MNGNDKYKFGGNREKVFERDGYKCVRCGLSKEEHIEKYKCNLSIDHIDGKGCNSKIKNNELSNLQTLCLSCHGSKDSRRALAWSVTIKEATALTGWSKTWLKTHDCGWCGQSALSALRYGCKDKLEKCDPKKRLCESRKNKHFPKFNQFMGQPVTSR